MALTILCGCLDGTESAFREVRWLQLQDVVVRERLSKMLGDELDKATTIITIVLEQIDSQLRRLGLEKTADAKTEEVSRRLLEVLGNSERSVTRQNRQANREVAK